MSFAAGLILISLLATDLASAQVLSGDLSHSTNHAPLRR